MISETIREKIKRSHMRKEGSSESFPRVLVARVTILLGNQYVQHVSIALCRLLQKTCRVALGKTLKMKKAANFERIVSNRKKMNNLSLNT